MCLLICYLYFSLHGIQGVVLHGILSPAFINSYSVSSTFAGFVTLDMLND